MKEKMVWKRLWARKYSPFLASAFILSYLENKRFGTAPNKMFVPEGGLMAYYFEAGEFENLAGNYERFLRKQNLRKYAVKYEQEFRDFLSYVKKVASVNPSRLSKKALSNLVKKLNDRIIQSSDHQFYAFLVSEGPALEVEKKLAKQTDGAKLLQDITTPYKATRISWAHLEFLRLAQNENSKALKHYASKYAWLPMYEPLDKPWTEKDFRRQLGNIKSSKAELAKYQKNQFVGLKAYKKYRDTLKDTNFKKQVEIVHYYSYLKEMRDDYRRHAYYLLAPFLAQLANLIGLSFKELNYLSILEVAQSVAQGSSVVSKTELSSRQKAFAFHLKNGKLKIYSGKRAQELGRKMIGSLLAKIKGSCASPGKVTGEVSIIYHQGEFDKFKQGNILVTTMTHPEFLPIMKRARAIVTDEGGITCHAAIVSRELGIPCIIGTKNVTRVLKDGDVVEVDADKGTVSKIKK